MAEISTFLTTPKVKVVIIRSAKGYRWSIEVTDEDPDAALSTLDQIEQQLRTKYGSTQ